MADHKKAIEKFSEYISSQGALGTVHICKELVQLWNDYYSDGIKYIGESHCNIYLTGKCRDIRSFEQVYRHFKPMDGTWIKFVDMGISENGNGRI